MKPIHWAILLGGLGALALAGYKGAASLAVNADFNAPPVQPADDRDTDLEQAMNGLNQPDGHRQHVCLPHQHYDGYVFTPHRFPRTVGGELTSAIHHGHTSAGIPAKGDLSEWMVRPPSEVAW